jgi:hypothetical protein
MRKTATITLEVEFDDEYTNPYLWDWIRILNRTSSEICDKTLREKCTVKPKVLNIGYKPEKG